MTAQEPVLEFESVSKVYRTGLRRRSVAALTDVTLHAYSGEILGLLGPNGAGKTTLMKLALGLLRPSSGCGRLLGQPLGDVGARRAVGFLPEEPYLYQSLTVWETLEMMAELSRIPTGDVHARAEAVIAQCELSPVRSASVRKLSRGWLRRVGLAIALVSQPRLLLLDEPLSGLDPAARMGVKNLIRSLRSGGTAVVISSHILPDVERLADRVALLRRGRLLKCCSLASLLGEHSRGYDIEARLQGPLELTLPHTEIWRRPAEQRVRWWFPELDEQTLQALLAQLAARGAAVLQVAPHRDSLEEIFVRAMDGASAADRRDGELAVLTDGRQPRDGIAGGAR